MKTAVRSIEGGRLVLRSIEHEPAIDADLLASARTEQRSFVRRVELDGRACWLKGGPLRGHARRRHALRRWLLRSELPRVRELQNLAWLRRRQFRAPEPLVAGSIESAGSASFQFLATLEVPDARPFDEAWPDLESDERHPILIELAREVARLHALHFVHRDLFLRNLLITPAEAGRRIAFLDAWRGGPGSGLRGPAYDLAALFLEGATLFDREEARALIDAYAKERADQDAPLDGATFWLKVERARESLVRTLEREPARARGRQVEPTWSRP